MIGWVNGLPGQNVGLPNNQQYQIVPIEIFALGRDRASFMPFPVVISGTLTDYPPSGPNYDFYILAGVCMGKVTTGTQSQKYTNGYVGVTTTATLSGATTIQVAATTGTEIVRRFGATGTFNLVGPPTAAGVVANQTVTYSAVSATGLITVTATSAAAVNGSLVAATDGSQNISTVLCDVYGIKMKDADNATRVDVGNSLLLSAGGGAILEDGTIWPLNAVTDASIQSYIKAQITGGCPGIQFRSNLQT